MKILWNVNIQTDKIIEHSRPDIVVFERELDLARLWAWHALLIRDLLKKEREIVDKYQELKYKLKRNCSEMTMIPVVIDALGAISKDFHKWINKTNPEICFGTL